MIKFFRKIRRDLLSNGEVGKYFKYAIGEIVLVVIGILIALQINNWNEHRKERKKEINILIEIVENLNTDVKNLDLKIAESKEFLERNVQVLEHLRNRTPLTDSLRQSYSGLVGHGNFQPTLMAYENLSTNGIEIIQDKSLRKAISELYSFKYHVFVDDRRTVVRRNQVNQSAQIQNKLRIFKAYESAQPIDLEELRDDVPFQNMLATNVFLLGWVINRYETGKEQILEVQKKIQNEIEKE